jgi:hypothetical protein
MMRAVWNGLAFTLIASFVCWLSFATIAPASWWYEIRSVRVVDSTVGETPIMHIDRTIHQDFLGTYIVDVEQMQMDGRFTVVCSAYARTFYRSDAVLPEPVTLDWWSWPIKCALLPGRYRVETTWLIETPLFPDKRAGVLSNEFLVK